MGKADRTLNENACVVRAAVPKYVPHAQQECFAYVTRASAGESDTANAAHMPYLGSEADSKSEWAIAIAARSPHAWLPLPNCISPPLAFSLRYRSAFVLPVSPERGRLRWRNVVVRRPKRCRSHWSPVVLTLRWSLRPRLCPWPSPRSS